ncbi:hypothetical protein, partial [Pseudomonas aeruginosa]|uniref:hypothetical protein n=1 Tax=Pseudomonas aeruginosa TaxID=287 RepID=UPI0020947931
SSLFEKFADWTPQAVTSNAASIAAVMAEVPELDAETQAKFRLADDLLIKVAGLERELFAEIQSAVAEEKHGYARSMIDTVNLRLAERLNLSKWWSQDKEFQLTVDLGEDELVFTITDRTDTSYSFNERSEGLKYFLSYFVQYLSHVPPADGEREILLMDEPDAFLSSS